MTIPSDARHLLHPPGGRWTFKHKDRVVQAVADGRITLDELVAAGISPEEFAGWQRAFDTYGHRGLKVVGRPWLTSCSR
jgi:threonine dehydrogenase-like Zn-dependent dehydrogenase